MSANVQVFHGRLPLVRALAQALAAVVSLLALVGVVLLFVWTAGEQRRAIGRLPETTRLALYVRTKTNLEQVCAPPSLGLSAYCGQQAKFLEEFPECDSSCHALAALQRW